jgi:hypothetical protein
MNPLALVPAEVLGVDIGGVLTDHRRLHHDQSEAVFLSKYLETPEQEGAFEILRLLVECSFGKHVYLVSRCKRRTEEVTRKWLIHRDFYNRTGILPEHIFFCLERAEKADICRRLGVTHFVDDRLEIHGYLEGIVKHRFLFRPSEKEVAEFVHVLPGVRRVESWVELLGALYH